MQKKRKHVSWQIRKKYIIVPKILQPLDEGFTKARIQEISLKRTAWPRIINCTTPKDPTRENHRKRKTRRKWKWLTCARPLVEHERELRTELSSMISNITIHGKFVSKMQISLKDFILLYVMISIFRYK